MTTGSWPGRAQATASVAVVTPGPAADVATALEAHLAKLDGTEAAAIAGSHAGAVAGALIALLRPGDHLLASAWLDGAPRAFLETELPLLGIAVAFVDPTETRSWRRGLRPETRALFVASPVPASTRVLDLRPLATLTREAGIALVVDASAASPALWRPAAHGADVVLHDAGVALDGHGGAGAGVVCGTEPFIEEVRARMARWGMHADPAAARRLAAAVATLELRVHRQAATARRLAEWAAGHPAIAAAWHPALPAHPDHDVAAAMLGGAATVLGLVPADPAVGARLLAAPVRLRSPLVPDGLATRLEAVPPDRARALGLPDGFLALRAGLEPADALIAALEEALA